MARPGVHASLLCNGPRPARVAPRMLSRCAIPPLCTCPPHARLCSRLSWALPDRQPLGEASPALPCAGAQQVMSSAATGCFGSAAAESAAPCSQRPPSGRGCRWRLCVAHARQLLLQLAPDALLPCLQAPCLEVSALCINRPEDIAARGHSRAGIATQDASMRTVAVHLQITWMINNGRLGSRIILHVWA